jgi:hypothetical protein
MLEDRERLEVRDRSVPERKVQLVVRAVLDRRVVLDRREIRVLEHKVLSGAREK